MTATKSQQKKTYIKHHSFENFRSHIDSDLSQQKDRIINLLREYLVHGQNPETEEILKMALEDLLSKETTEAFFKINTYISDELSHLEDKDVCRYVYHRYRYDVFPIKKILDRFPPYVQIEPTSICNYRCVFCYQSDKSFSEDRKYLGSMTIGLFKDIIDKIEKKVEFLSLSSRGEPFICKDIDKMLEYCIGKFLALKVNTNASLLTEKHCHALLSGGVNTVVFSADAAGEPLYSQLRVNGQMERVLKNIEMFRSIKEKHYPNSRMITRVSGVWVDAQQEISHMMTTWGELVDQVCFVSYNPWENVYESSPGSVQEPCSDLWRRMFIWYSGDVNPCDTDYKSTLTVGNIQNKSIEELWHSQGYQQLREDHLNNQRGRREPCRRCTVI